MIIPGFVISWVTFPGVVFHELAHALFCRLFGLEIYKVQYFRFSIAWGQPVGYVIHKPSQKAWQNVLVGVGPFFLNTIVGAIVAFPAALTVLQFGGGDLFDYFLIWLGVSIAMHAFPSTGDARSIWSSLKAPKTSVWTKVLGTPIVAIIYLGAFGSMLWLDAIYGVFIAGLLPRINSPGVSIKKTPASKPGPLNQISLKARSACRRRLCRRRGSE